jgi:hypothetical protein
MHVEDKQTNMAQGTLCYITPVTGEHPDQGLPPGSPGTPTHPIEIPPLPPGAPAHPIVLPPSGGYPSHPIFIPATPEHPIALPPGTVWPPLNPGDGVGGQGWLLVVVVGSDGRHKWKWIAVSAPPIPGVPTHPIEPPMTGGKPPQVPQPK